MIKTLNLSNEADVREKVLTGIAKMNELVGMTLGPNGRSVLIDRGTEPLIVDDGRRVAENMKLEDPVSQLAVRVAYEVTRKTDEKVGDGTTTSMVLTNAILQDISDQFNFGDGFIDGDADVNEIDRKLHASKDVVVKKLREMATEVKTEKQLIDVATVCVGDDKLGEIIGKMYYKLGKDGHINLEFNLISQEIQHSVVPGYRFSGGYAANWMITDEIKKICHFTDVKVLVANTMKLEASDIQGLMNEVGNSGAKKMVIIAPKFSEAFLRIMYRVAVKSTFPVLCVRAPGQGEEAYKDMAVFTGGKYFSKDDDFTKITKADLGHLGHIEVSDDTVELAMGGGDSKAINKRIKEVTAELGQQKVHRLKQLRHERISALTGQNGLIEIGAPTDEERNWIKHKIEDARWATKHAYREGIVIGGGQAFKKIADELPDDDLLKTALLAPLERLKKNAGGKFKVGKNIFDPVAVEIAAIEYAVSATSKLLRVGGAVAFEMPSLVDELQALLSRPPAGEEEE